MTTSSTTPVFKTYERSSRVQTTEEAFTSGMCFQDTPLTEGQLRLLVNYDINSDATAIEPRQGLQQTEFTGTKDNGIQYSSDLTLDQIKYCYEQSQELLQMLYNKSETATQISNTLYNVEGGIITIPINNNYMKYTSDPITFVCNKPSKSSIHDVEISESKHLLNIVGTFGFNNSFFGFQTKDDERSMFYTKMSEEDKIYKAEDVELKVVTPKEAATWGYNMLLANPYDFKCDESGQTLTINGLLPYSTSGELCMSPVLNQDIDLKLFYAAPKGKTYTFKMDYRESQSSAEWQLIDKAKTITLTDDDDFQPVTFRFTPPAESIIIRVRVYEGSDDTTTELTAIGVGFSFNKETYGSTANVDAKNYDLTLCRGMAYWKNRLILWAPPEDSTMIFMSDVNDPGYFPYPNNVDFFDNPIIKVLPFMDNLLVFTTDSLYMLTLSEDGLSWTSKLIQTHLNINEWDMHLMTVVKNMVFFKSGNYYYMVVPKLNSTTGELTIAPISKNIKLFLDNFMENVENILKLLYNYSSGIELIHYYNYIDFEDINNVYVFKHKASETCLNVALIYNSVSRHWRMHIYESINILHPYKLDATKRSNLLGFISVNGSAEIQFVERSNTSKADLTSTIATRFPNYQLLDTGNRSIYEDYKKRFREVQIKINNKEDKLMQFATKFDVDNEIQKAFPDYFAIVDTYAKENTVMLQERFDTMDLMQDALQNTKYNYWFLGTEVLPCRSFWKIRIPVAGKGYTPRLQFISANQSDYELLAITWVYRQLYSK